MVKKNKQYIYIYIYSMYMVENVEHKNKNSKGV